ncbi:hypothetical protein FJ365_00095 [Candidatus Dependentiae bacterium]|nr:hypothetical protein [Candidatus Dependentiae bacterium]
MKTNNIRTLWYSIFLLLLTLNASASTTKVLPCFYDQTADKDTDDESNTSASENQVSDEEQTASDSDSNYYDCNEEMEPSATSLYRRHPVIPVAPVQAHIDSSEKLPRVSCCTKCTTCCYQYAIPIAVGGIAAYCTYCYPRHTLEYAVMPIARCCNCESAPMATCGACCSGLCCPKKCDSCLKKGCCWLLLCCCSYACSPYR